MTPRAKTRWYGAAPGRQIAIFLFIDAFGWEQLRQRPFLDDILQIKAPLETILGYSSTCDPTIITGKLPRDHGHFTFFYYSPATSPFKLCRWLGLLPRTLTERGRVRHLMSRFLRRGYGYTGYFQLYNVPFRYLPLFDYSEKRDIYQPGGINGGVETIFDRLRERRVPFFLSDWRRSEEWNVQALKQAVKKRQIRFAYLYWAGMDALLHADGPRSARVDAKIRWYEQQVRQVLELTGRHYGDVRIYLFSDHGMTAVQERCDLMTQVDRLGFQFGVDYVAAYDSTMARFWFLNDLAREEITDLLDAEPHGRILSPDDLVRYGCDFPDQRYGEAIYLVDPGVLICPSHMGLTMLAGMHGYDPRHQDSFAMFAANTRPVHVPQRLDDLYALMRDEVDR